MLSLLASSYQREVSTALDLTRAACRAAAELQGGIARRSEATQKADRDGTGFGVSPVTVADFTVQCLLLGSLTEEFPDDRFIAEETSADLLAADAATREAVVAAVSRCSGREWSEADACAALDLGLGGTVDGWSRQGRTWVLDPIDGTKGFLRGDQYAVALSLLEGGQPMVGLLGCPNLAPTSARASRFDAKISGGTLTWAARGIGAHQRSALLEVRHGLDLDEKLRVSDEAYAPHIVRCEAAESAHSSYGTAAAAASACGFDSMVPIRIDGQGKYSCVARGEAHVYTRLPKAGYRENIWDHAAGALIVEEAGGRVSDLNGDALDFSEGAKLDARVTGIIATNGKVHDMMLEALRDVGDFWD
tara:strand:- start:1387 stop:2472 length:1086 start_codon:yes stop_codon:yes gene_type:complete